MANPRCLALPTRSYRRTASRLLDWSALAFIDLALLPSRVDPLPLRNLTFLVAMDVLLFGFVCEAS